MKKRLWLVLIVLSITPFARGCDITSGFPLPAFIDITDAGFPSFLTQGPLRSVLMMLANILILAGLAVMLIKKEKTLSWLHSFYQALLINIWINWNGFLIFMFCSQYETLPKPLDILYRISFYYHYKVPYFVSEKVNPRGAGWLDDILFRAWFITVTLLATLLFYWFSKRKR